MINSTALGKGQETLKSLEIPSLPEWPERLPSAEETPEGTLLPSPLDDVVNERLVHCASLELRFADVLRKTLRVERARTRAELAKERAKIASEISERYTSEYEGYWPLWQVGLAIGGGILGGVLVGALVGVAIDR